MNPTKETRWLCEHSKVLEKFSGKCVVFNIMEGVVSDGESTEKFLWGIKKMKPQGKPFLFHVPSKDELTTPMPVIRSS